MIEILLIALGLNAAGNVFLAFELRKWQPKRDRRGRFAKKD